MPGRPCREIPAEVWVLSPPALKLPWSRCLCSKRVSFKENTVFWGFSVCFLKILSKEYWKIYFPEFVSQILVVDLGDSRSFQKRSLNKATHLKIRINTFDGIARRIFVFRFSFQRLLPARQGGERAQSRPGPGSPSLRWTLRSNVLPTRRGLVPHPPWAGPWAGLAGRPEGGEVAVP